MNIYEMYYANGKKFGFWIKRNSWDYHIAKVTEIESVLEGEDIPGKQPYFNNQKVKAEFYNQTNIENCNSGNLIETIKVSCPGTFAYTMLQ